jgi:hypothetical protein
MNKISNPATRMDIGSWRGAYTLFKKEILRFWRVAFQTVASPVLTALLYLLIFSHVLEGHVQRRTLYRFFDSWPDYDVTATKRVC